jgi:hypothetical protein
MQQGIELEDQYLRAWRVKSIVVQTTGGKEYQRTLGDDNSMCLELLNKNRNSLILHTPVIVGLSQAYPLPAD